MGVGNIANTGLKAAMTNMETISNNISNVNTVGFKKSTANFSDIYAGSMNSTTQAGLGVKITSITQDFSSAGTEFTNRGLDLSLCNDGFFVQKNSGTGQTSYTRNGQFDVDNKGYLISSSGRIQGYSAINGQIMGAGALIDLQIPNNPTPAKATSKSSFVLNLDAGAKEPASAFSNTDANSYNYRTDSTLYDSLGNPYNLSVFYIKALDNNWTTQMSINDQSVGAGALSFNSDGTLSTVTGMDNLSWTPLPGAVTPQTISIDLAGTTQFAGSSEMTLPAAQDGYPAGIPTGFNIDSSGVINVSYSNGSSQVGGQVAVARFIAPQGLVKADNMSWLATLDSGSPIINPNSSAGAISTGSLELSNVDLTEELVNLMSAQHDFQASAQVAQTYNQVLQTIEKL